MTYVPTSERVPLSIGGRWLIDINNHHIVAMEVAEYEALVARLEAAEAVCRVIEEHLHAALARVREVDGE
jgi:hypothetical protein